ncbi:MAG: hypothetical protein DMF51_03185 [Acidobacteria bacterium]|nr:MAG: hypothetical protein DMF51_03185 [Acidobacteriota bacterium]
MTPQRIPGSRLPLSGHRRLAAEMIVWGGYDGVNYLSSGARYDPVTDTWRSISGLGAPSPRGFHTAVWADNLMLVWGGYDGNPSAPFATGARYDPRTDSWTPISGSNAPSGRYIHAATWTGSEMLIWGGLGNGSGNGSLNSGARYEPKSDVWTPITMTNTPGPRYGHSAVWTGRLLLVWGGVDSVGGISESGGRYDPLNDSWTATATSNRPIPRIGHSAVWTGNKMIVWGGLSLYSLLNSGASYDPLTASWTAISTLNAPSRRSDHVAIWTGSVMVVWGGVAGEDRGGTGGRYDLVADSWSPTSTAGAPGWNIYRKGASVVWTGTEMIVWGGVDSGDRYFGNGGRYDPAADAWLPTPLTGAPVARANHAAVWTGDAMLVWGGFTRPFFGPDTYLDDGYAYHPVTDSWVHVSHLGAPSPREHATALWTGEQMLIWGGDSPSGGLGDGAAYVPQMDAWETIDTNGAPPPFISPHTAVWADPVMIVWGNNDQGSDSGGRYSTTTNTWKPVSTSGAPSGRAHHSAVWTGEEMIVWGGDRVGSPLDTGGAYRVDLSPDADHDGYTVCAGDCDDANPDVHPGAVELCNGRDDDCDGLVDDDFSVGTGCVSDVDSCHQLVGALSCKPDGTGTQCTGVVTLHDLTAPAIICPADVNLECPAGAANIGRATASDACDPTPIITNDASPIMPLGAMVVDWTATDASGNRASCPERVNVRDTTPPGIAVVTTPSVLWPPNHRMVDVAASVAASDACGTPAVSLVSIASTEPDNSAGTGDGNTVNDIQGPVPGSDDFNFALRAERDGGGGGRVYRVTYSAVDGSGNRSVTTSFVFVPHDEAGVTEPLLLSVENGPAGTRLTWDPVPGALSYRVVRGRVGSLRETGAFIDLGTGSCVQPPSSATSTEGHDDAENPPAGEAFFYVAAYDDGRDSGFGTVSAAKPRVLTGGGCE